MPIHGKEKMIDTIHVSKETINKQEEIEKKILDQKLDVK